MIVAHAADDVGEPHLMRLPIGFLPRKNWRASVSLIIATGGDSVVSRPVNGRPARIAICSVSKYPGKTRVLAAMGILDRSRPSIEKTRCDGCVVGTLLAAVADRTP